MVMSLIFIVGFFSLFLLPITCIFIVFSSDLSATSQPPRTSSTAAAKSYVGSVWRLLLHRTIFSDGNSPEVKDAVAVRRYEGRREAEECTVCLCEVEEGEEITDLRCSHVFHKVCMDAWIGSGRATCPLCRGRVFSPAAAEEGGDGGYEVVMFRFCSSTSGSRRARREGNWWLR